MFQSKQNNKSYTIDDYFDSYKEYTSGNPLYKISRDKFRSIVTDYFKFISDEVIANSKEFKFPARMGSLYVFKKKPIKYNFTYLRVDFKSTKESNKTILHLNEHSDGYNYRFRWSKKDMMMKNSSLYELVMTRANKRRLAKAIKQEGRDYIEIK